MDHKADDFTRVFTLLEEAHLALAEAASVLKNANHDEELTYTAIRLEAETCILQVQLRKAFNAFRTRSKPRCKVALEQPSAASALEAMTPCQRLGNLGERACDERLSLML